MTMVPNRGGTTAKRSAIDAERIDFSVLLGRELTFFSEQFPGKPIKSKVVMAGDGEISIDRAGPNNWIDNLVNNQRVTIRVAYKGQQIALPATLKRGNGGRCWLIPGNKVVPLTRRRFARVAMTCRVKLAVVPVSTFSRKKLPQLRWLETITTNISGGGVRIDSSSYLENPTYLFLNIDLQWLCFPPLMLGQVLYALAGGEGHFGVGIKFVVKEEARQRFPLTIQRQLPPVVFQYSERGRNEVNSQITRWLSGDKQI